MPKQQNEKLAPIRADAVYPLPFFQQAMGLAKAALRTMRRNGLPVRKIGVRSYISGQEFLDWFSKNAPLIGGPVAT
jgi:hypothetical protein